MRLASTVALITGAARGIGEGIARSFIEEDATVWLTDIDDATDLARTLGPAARFALLDVRDEAAWDETMARVIARDGKLDVLVNNAGVTGFEAGTGPHDPEHVSLEEWRAVHAINLDGTFLGCRAAIRA